MIYASIAMAKAALSITGITGNVVRMVWLPEHKFEPIVLKFNVCPAITGFGSGTVQLGDAGTTTEATNVFTACKEGSIVPWTIDQTFHNWAFLWNSQLCGILP